MFQILTFYLVVQYLLLGIIVLSKSKGEKNNRLLALCFISIAIEDLISYTVRNFKEPNVSYYLLSVIYNFFELTSYYFILSFSLNLIGQKGKLFISTLLAFLVIIVCFTVDFLLNKASDASVMNFSRYELISLLYGVLAILYINAKLKGFQKTDQEYRQQLTFRVYYLRIFFLVNLVNILVAYTLPVTAYFVSADFYTSELESIQTIIHNFIFVPCQTILVLGITYLLLLKPEVLERLEHNEGENFEERLIKTLSNASQESKPKMKEEKYQEIVRILEEVIVEKQLYLNPDLTVKLLAEKTNVKVHDLSVVINRHYGKSFKSLINNLRTEQAKKMLADTGHNFTMYQVALESGFNSESMFYHTFKQLTGVSPLEYRKQKGG